MRERNIFIGLALISFLIVVLRAIHVPLFHDEVVTFNHFIKSGILSPFSEYRAANNHLTNSVLSRCFYLLFGDSPISLRLANVLFFIPYCYFLFKLGLKLKSKWAKWGFYLSCLFSFQFVVFFALSRGYGIAFACVLASLYHLGNLVEKVTLKTLIYVMIFLIIGLFAFFSLLLFVMISIGVIGYSLYIQRNTIAKKQWVGISVFLIMFLSAIGFAVYVLFYYKGYGILWFGFLEGFWRNTVQTLIQLIFVPGKFQFALEVLVILFSVLILGVNIFHFKVKQLISKENIWFVFLFLNVFGILLLAWIFEVNYPYQRTGLHLYLLFIGALCFAIDKLPSKILRRVVLIPLFLIPMHYVVSFNLDYISLWVEDTLPYSFYETMEKFEKEKPTENRSSLYIEGTAISVWSYGVYKWYPSLPICSSNIDTNSRHYDYIIDRKQNMKSISHLYDSIDAQPFSDVRLYKRKKSVTKSLYKSFSFDSIKSDWDFKFSDFKTDSLNSSSLWFDFETEIKFLEYPVHVYLVFSAENPETHEKYSYKFIEFDRLIDWDKPNKLRYTEILNDLPQDREIEIKVYLWNRYQVNYELDKSELNIYEIAD